MIYTTLAKIRQHDPCTGSWERLLASLDKTKADDEPLSMGYILETLGVADCLWAFQSIPDQIKIAKVFACDCAEHVLPIFDKKRPEDQRPRKCIEVSRKFINGEATADELDKARRAAYAAYAVDAAAYAVDAAADAAAAAGYAVDADAADAAAYAAGAADAADDAADDDERQWQKDTLSKALSKGTRS